MDKYINAEKLEKKVQNIRTEDNCRYHYSSYMAGASQMRRQIQELIVTEPAADVQEVKHAHWISKGYYIAEGICFDDVICCSNCGKEYNRGKVADLLNNNEVFAYCPNCIAKMDEEEKI